MMVPAPFNTTTALKRLANTSAEVTRSASRCATDTLSKRAASPGWGVNMKVERWCGISASLGLITAPVLVFDTSFATAAANAGVVEIRLSASASSTTGTLSASVAASNLGAVRSVPIPMPIASASIPSIAINSSALRTMISGLSGSYSGVSLATMPRNTLPGPMNSAARAASTAAPTMPSAPPMMATLP